ncbi:PREDICTED: uncharacterized protein LOC108359970 [Rhagoletis zephyria]|uniref:uncharacterized protein LOC108359970 n=1 Tax=Rhagoletis zephyria TaxID=28612 RepID=UPI000811906B|nr:PREDICTED: uncharacterized protein LOC108359970 [Rhagoletis zephyria]
MLEIKESQAAPSSFGEHLWQYTGTDISVTSAPRKTSLTPPQLLLQVENCTRIESYGEKAVVLNVALRQPIRSIFCVANVPYPNIVADLIHTYEIIVELRRGCMIDPNTGSQSKGSYATAQITTIIALNEAGKFTEALKEFPELLGNPSNRTAKKHSVKHFISITGPPCVEHYNVEAETGKRVQCIRSDNGLEFVNKDMADIFRKRKVVNQKSTPYTPEHNGRAERDMRTIIEGGRYMIHAKELSLKY